MFFYLMRLAQQLKTWNFMQSTTFRFTLRHQLMMRRRFNHRVLLSEMSTIVSISLRLSVSTKPILFVMVTVFYLEIYLALDIFKERDVVLWILFSVDILEVIYFCNSMSVFLWIFLFFDKRLQNLDVTIFLCYLSSMRLLHLLLLSLEILYYYITLLASVQLLPFCALPQ